MAKTWQSGLLALMLALIWSIPAQAATADLPPPNRVIESVFEQAVAALVENQEAIRADPKEAYELIDNILTPHVHIPLMTRLVLGRHAREASEEQIAAFSEAFHETIIRTYSTMLSDNLNTVIEAVEDSDRLLQIRDVSEPDQRGRVTVRTQLRVEESPIPVIYRMIATDEGWRVYDVVIENISFVTNYRDQYSSEISRGSLDQLTSQLEERNRQAWNN